jgi:L-aspartate oxidase
LAAAPAPELPPAALETLRAAMSANAGVERTAAGLTILIDQIDALKARYGPALPLVAARLIAQAALERRESRGAHYRADFPALAATARRTLIEDGRVLTLEAAA